MSFHTQGAVSIGEDIDFWEMSLARAPALVCGVVHHAASKRLVGLYQRSSSQFCLRTMSLVSLKAETIAFDAPAEEFSLFRSSLPSLRLHPGHHVPVARREGARSRRERLCRRPARG